jgi:hypothetical protein
VVAVLGVNSQVGADIIKPVLAERVAVEGLAAVEGKMPQLQVSEMRFRLPAGEVARQEIISLVIHL